MDLFALTSRPPLEPNGHIVQFFCLCVPLLQNVGVVH
jgi:hypothetical protein